MSFITLQVRKTFENPEQADLLKYELAQMGFDSFWEEENGNFTTSVEEANFDHSEIQNLLQSYQLIEAIDYQVDKVEKQNWNQLWEQNYAPVFIDDVCVIRADFHQIEDKKFLYEIIINPKMSFGTGHHETTALCVKHLIDLDMAGKKVADIGCGTGILAIMALKKGATTVLGCDVEDWAVENAQENILLNGFDKQKFEVFRGTAAQVKEKNFDVVLANINLNILLAEIHLYHLLLANHGKLLLSGFYEHETYLILQEAQKYGLFLEKQLVKNRWTAILLGK
jgi:ribosomal protein L11 methyltransferase